MPSPRAGIGQASRGMPGWFVMSVEDLAQPRLAAPMPVGVGARGRMVVGVDEIGAARTRVDDNGLTRVLCCGSFEQLVQFAAVEPDAAAVGAVVDLDALSIRHDKGLAGTVRALHG